MIAALSVADEAMVMDRLTAVCDRPGRGVVVSLLARETGVAPWRLLPWIERQPGLQLSTDAEARAVVQAVTP